MGSKVVRVGSAKQLRDGLEAALGRSGVVKIDGKPVKSGVVIDLLDELIASAAKTAQAKSAYRSAVAEEHALDAETQSTLAAVRAHILGSFTQDQLAACGIVPKKKGRRPLSAAERLAATVKTRATRAAHGRKPGQLVREQEAVADVIAAYAPQPAAPSTATAAAGPEAGPAPAPVTNIATH
jgi:hypothetical protein